MWPRLRLDVGWGDLACGLVACASARGAEARARRVEEYFSAERDALACLSVRSGFDLLLSALELPRGSEVLVSALTIPDMPRILAAHGLVAVPVDLELADLAPRVEVLEAALGARTRALLFAHLFGTRVNVEPMLAFARRHRLLFLEDAAQAFTGDDWRGHDQADATMFSFGTIKTATALGGAVLRVRDPYVRERMRELQRAWPRASRGAYARKIVKCAGLKLLGSPAIFGAFARLCRALRIDHDGFVHRAVRGFPGADLLQLIRRAPPAPLLALLERRLSLGSPAHIAERAALGEELARSLPADLDHPGDHAETRTHWVFPVVARDPQETLGRLRRAGFDATRRSSLVAVEPAPRVALDALSRIVYVPLSSGLERSARSRLLSALRGGELR